MAFLAVDVDPTEDADDIRKYKEQQGYPWDMAPGTQEAIINYRVFTTATKFVVGKDGVIVFKADYGVQKSETWEQVLQEVAQE